MPVWTLATTDVDVPTVLDGPMTSSRLAELRTGLAALANTAIATLEAHPVPKGLDRSRGIALDAASPLAKHLSQLISQTAKSTSGAGANIGTTGEVLYRMVVPGKVAAQVGKGLVSPMASKVGGGIHSALVGSSGIAAQATFVPVAANGSAAAGAAVGSAGTAAVAAGGVGALTIAAPLVLMAVAVGVSAHAEQQRQQSMQRITDLLEQLHDAALDSERSELDGCRDAIEKATALVLDQGRIGVSLGLDSAVHAISKAIAAADRRLAQWNKSLEDLPVGPVEVATLVKSFPGIEQSGGKFHAHLELARLAITLKQRVIVLQAVEHAQLDQGNSFESFLRTLRADQQRVTTLMSGIESVLLELSRLELTRSRGWAHRFFTPNEVDELIGTAYRLRELGDGVAPATATQPDVVIEVARETNGSVIVFPAQAA